MDTIKPLFTATATATGGRNGHTQASDGSVSADLSVPKAMGGPGKPGTTTPEHLFAAGYAACFGGALDFVGATQEGCQQGQRYGRRVDRTARRRRLRAGSEAARRRLDFTASGVGGARQGGAREDLPVLQRYARQRRCAARGQGGLEVTPIRASFFMNGDSISEKVLRFAQIVAMASARCPTNEPITLAAAATAR
jgi:organic hydroperoxide reductase OsmC/OhrA